MPIGEISFKVSILKNMICFNKRFSQKQKLNRIFQLFVKLNLGYSSEIYITVTRRSTALSAPSWDSSQRTSAYAICLRFSHSAC